MTDEVVTPLTQNLDDNGVDINVTVIPPNESESDEHELSDDISAFQAVAAQILGELRTEIASQIGPLREEVAVLAAFVSGIESEVENVSESVETIETTIQEATSESEQQEPGELSGESIAELSESPESVTASSESEPESDAIEPKSSHWYWRHIGK